MDDDKKKGPIIFALNSTRRFGEKLVANGVVYETTFPDGEVYVRPDEDIRGADIFVVQSLHNFGDDHESLGDKLWKLAIFCNASHHASADRITAVIPYLAYSRQDRKTEGRAPLSAQALADTLQANFVNRLLTMDPPIKRSNACRSSVSRLGKTPSTSPMQLQNNWLRHTPPSAHLRAAPNTGSRGAARGHQFTDAAGRYQLTTNGRMTFT